jgi:hypothetical protein
LSIISLREPYKTRSIRFLELWEADGWRLKVYGIAYAREYPASALTESAKQRARTYLPRIDQQHYGVGFIGIHEGRGSNFVFVDWWAEENELHHHVFVSPSDRPEQFNEVTSTGLIACVWDLRVLSFERQAWIDTILACWDAPDLDKYLMQRLNENV